MRTYVEVPNAAVTQAMIDASPHSGTPKDNTCRKTTDGYHLMKFEKVPTECSGYTQWTLEEMELELYTNKSRWGEDQLP